MKYTPENIKRLRDGEIFVFGSNLAGVHGAGAALIAAQKFGAIFGKGVGPMGQSYAIPTKDERLRRLLIPAIEGYIGMFYLYADRHPELTFFVTKIGCGLAGYSVDQIGPLFTKGRENIVLPREFYQ